jgi:hypothetical protein
MPARVTIGAPGYAHEKAKRAEMLLHAKPTAHPIGIFLVAALVSGLLTGCTDSDLSESQRVILKASSDRSVEASKTAVAGMDECDRSIDPFTDQARRDLTLDARARIFQPCLGQGHLYRTECIEALADGAEVLDAKHGTSNAASIRIACTNAISANEASDKASHEFFDAARGTLIPSIAPSRAPAPAPVFINQRRRAAPLRIERLKKPLASLKLFRECAD